MLTHVTSGCALHSTLAGSADTSIALAGVAGTVEPVGDPSLTRTGQWSGDVIVFPEDDAAATMAQANSAGYRGKRRDCAGAGSNAHKRERLCGVSRRARASRDCLRTRSRAVRPVRYPVRASSGRRSQSGRHESTRISQERRRDRRALPSPSLRAAAGEISKARRPHRHRPVRQDAICCG